MIQDQLFHNSLKNLPRAHSIIVKEATFDFDSWSKTRHNAVLEFRDNQILTSYLNYEVTLEKRWAGFIDMPIIEISLKTYKKFKEILNKL